MYIVKYTYIQECKEQKKSNKEKFHLEARFRVGEYGEIQSSVSTTPLEVALSLIHCRCCQHHEKEMTKT